MDNSICVHCESDSIESGQGDENDESDENE
jgi:hypothetical protein